MVRVSPDEDIEMVFCAMNLCLDSGDRSDDDKKKWGKIRRNIPHKFMLVKPDQINVMIASIREERLETADATSWSVTPQTATTKSPFVAEGLDA